MVGADGAMVELVGVVSDEAKKTHQRVNMTRWWVWWVEVVMIEVVVDLVVVVS